METATVILDGDCQTVRLPKSVHLPTNVFVRQDGESVVLEPAKPKSWPEGFFDSLVHDGHLYVLETPLFRVRNKERTLYCYSNAERDEAVKTFGGKPEITRFKGLGEISPGEFKQFIGKEMRLSRVEYAPKPDAGGILDFYMGRNTPERKDYIMDRLVVPVEE